MSKIPPPAGYVRLLVVMITVLSLTTHTAIAARPTPPPLEEVDELSASDESFSAPEAETKKNGNTNTWLIIGGAAALGLAAVALGSSGGGGGSSSDASDEVITDTDIEEDEDEDDEDKEESSSSSEDSDDGEETETVYTGPDLAGDGWNGYVNLVNSGNVNTSISASVSQDGSSIKIYTTSPYSYAKSFSGKISNGGYIKVKDNSTGETWTTLYGSATANHFVLYDYVNDFTDLDKLEVSR